MNKTATAIVSAYNEAPRIGPVLDVLLNAKSVSKIIVVDDGSEDNLQDIVKKNPEVHYIKNERNYGKGYCMQLGSMHANTNILLFCDADLEGLTPKIIDEVIEPVQSGEWNMFIGVFETPSRAFFNKIFLLFSPFPSGMNSGLRALRREVWDLLPNKYKHGYLTELALNYLVRWRFGGFLYENFPYKQVIKEKKYGLVEGTLLRTWMNIQIFIEFFLIHMYERFFGFGKNRTMNNYQTTYTSFMKKLGFESIPTFWDKK